ncbi:radical SAM protein [Deinococcus cellulosilyticus]|uniref:Amino acid ABC transporter substrate-binding protein n=1 Tax=Deinococcus cellulosilyticus (strain DSM 18568 / NBRC 106333 / KACC 11606 / 5516J-15) TaxID=1223518 RepID=A0A511N5R2_DEIC1|nr:radical SAM protein [Deinococcus cellulosilyticus]GEM47797.1 amino acid ABC transporter substrate-binding protein [Deinococcus cellulosilyticus NBRC 106333 = KACC 11606]
MKHHLYPHSTTFSPDPQRVFSFDLEGRLISVFKGGVVYKRDLSSNVHVRYQQEGRQREVLNPEQARRFFEDVERQIQDLLPILPEDLVCRLRDRYTPDQLLDQKAKFLQVYRPISILPPDQYLSVVLQATEGCTWNKCTFCNFYADRPFKVKTPEEFAKHVQEVQAFFGEGVRLRKSVFLADGNALALSFSRLQEMLFQTRQAFPGLPVASFIDVFTGSRHTPEEWTALKDLGLQRVFIGMESGLDEVLRFINKPGSQADLLEFVSELKHAGLQVGLILMVGVGGHEFREPHAEASLEALKKMPLDAGDLIYLSPFVEHPGFTYSEKREAAGLTPMSEPEVETELALMAKRVRSMGLKAARYDIREFLY